MATTNHAHAIERLRSEAPSDVEAVLSDADVAKLLAADLLELHDHEAISLDGWVAAREFVERQADIIVAVNGV